MLKYPRTPHLEGSGIQPGDDPATTDFSVLAGRLIVVEEKLDGANAGLSFNEEGEMRLQSRGHYLDGGAREKHFALFKTWASVHQGALWERLGSRYLMYGEWLYAKHTIFYDRLPHYFCEFDIWDRLEGVFLDTSRRRALLEGLPVVSVPVLYAGLAPPGLLDWLKNSLYKSEDWWLRLRELALELRLNPERIGRETDPSPLSEGLYIKVEEQGQVLERYKFVRSSFLTSVLDSESHWLDRPIVPNQLAPGVDLFAC
ncbi:MAG: RNA ligase family protein [Candidatus Eremiobacteraeota bacterium]|nr:RNA ligase family protein [Candidatus Eremiobacteraeota bacterium]MCW5869324.1 RNA ligase family protein [Candidatus Eremiobacteraeota bacterium]